MVIKFSVDMTVENFDTLQELLAVIGHDEFMRKAHECLEKGVTWGTSDRRFLQRIVTELIDAARPDLIGNEDGAT